MQNYLDIHGSISHETTQLTHRAKYIKGITNDIEKR